MLLAGEPEVYPDLSGEREPAGELSELDRALLSSIIVEVPKGKRPGKPKGSRSRPKRGHKKPVRRKNNKNKARGG